MLAAVRGWSATGIAIRGVRRGCLLSSLTMTDPFVVVALVACWGAVVAVWVVGAIYNAARAPQGAARMQSTSVALAVGSIAVVSVVVLLGRMIGQGLTTDNVWVRLLGLVVLVSSTLFALWARFALGTSWSVAPRVGGDRRLRTTGPYAVTRHPIYTGLVGMVLGTSLSVGIGQSIVAVAAALIVAEVKIRMEEELLMAVFPDEYARYRLRVPQLIPGLRVRREN